MYTTTINQNGMILLNKAAREMLGVKLGDRVMVRTDKQHALVEREMTDEEFFEKLDAMKSEKTKRRIREIMESGKTLEDLEKEYLSGNQFKEEIEEKHGTV